MTPTSSEWSGLGGTFNPFGGQLGQAPGGQQRVDMLRQHLQYEVPGGIGLAMAETMPLAGAFTGTLWQGSRQGEFTTNRLEVVQRDGTNTTETLRLGASGLAAIEGGLSLYSGVDDYPIDDTTKPTKDDTKPTPKPTPNPTPTEPPPPKPVPQPTHWQVQPFEGVNVRSSPTTQGDNKVAIVQSGSFLDGTGETQKDQDGYTWIKVHGRDQEDKMVDGWVRSDNLKSYDKRYGDNDASGRVNPAREQSGQNKIVVQQDDNLWNLAAQYGQDFDQMLAANPHLLDPSLVFKGDSVYLPSR
jgi:LysM repeat protein